MNLHVLLAHRAANGKPLRVLLIGAGKFGSMFLSQVRRTQGLHLVAVADLSPQRAKESLARVGWRADQYAASSFDEARRRSTTFVTDDAPAAIANDAIEIVIDATGSPAAGIRHVLACCKHGKHIVMVNVGARRASCIRLPMAISQH
jgi:predicted homoserine dehydrogenase-like protein